MLYKRLLSLFLIASLSVCEAFAKDVDESYTDAKATFTVKSKCSVVTNVPGEMLNENLLKGALGGLLLGNTDGITLSFGDIKYIPTPGKTCTINVSSDLLGDYWNECRDTVSFGPLGVPHFGAIVFSCGPGIDGQSHMVSATITDYDKYLVLTDGDGHMDTNQKIRVNSVGFDFNSIAGKGKATKSELMSNVAAGMVTSAVGSDEEQTAMFDVYGIDDLSIFTLGGSITLPSTLASGLYVGHIHITVSML